MIVSGAWRQTGHMVLTCTPLLARQTRVAMLLRIRIQIEVCILERVFNFQIQLPLKGWSESGLWVARRYALLRLNCPFEVAAHMILSSSEATRVWGIARISLTISFGSINEIFSQFHPDSFTISLTFYSSSPLVRGPWIIDLNGP